MAIFAWFMLKDVPDKLGTAKNEVKSDIKNEFTERLHSMEVQLAVLGAKLELRDPRAAEKLPEIIKDKATTGGTGAQLKLNMEQVKAITTQAKDLGIVSSPTLMVDAGSSLLRLASYNPGAAPESWEAISAFINYQGFMFTKTFGLPLTKVTQESKPCIIDPPSKVSGTRTHVSGDVYKISPLIFTECVQVLDGVFWDNVEFDGCVLVYRGGNVGWGILLTRASIYHVELSSEPKPHGKDLLRLIVEQSSPQIKTTSKTASF